MQTENKNRDIPMPDSCQKYSMRPASPEEAGLFYAQAPEQDEALGAIGHVRIDFGHGGKEFWHTWHPRGAEELNSPEFKAELDEVVGQLRKSVLQDLSSMRSYCYHHGGEIEGGICTQNYGYTVETERYRYLLRCNPIEGDYQAYLSCFDKQAQALSEMAVQCNGEQATFPNGWREGDLCYLITNKAKRYTLPYTVESFDGTYFGVRGRTGLYHRVSPGRMFHTREDAVASLQESKQKGPLIGRVTFASGEQIEYTDPAEYLRAIREELPYHATSGFRYETLTRDPEVRKAVDDMLYDLYGEENPRPLEDYQEQSEQGMTMGGM